MNADWTIKPKKRENRFGDLAGLPYAGMSPRFCRLRGDCGERLAIYHLTAAAE
jgi:hypothetical protein